jgi:hypothetical protein
LREPPAESALEHNCLVTPKAAEVRRRDPKPRLRNVRLEDRTAPKNAVNHDETLLRETARSQGFA